jgi:small multidrug resistance pump
LRSLAGLRSTREIHMPYLILTLAVIAETVGTSALQASQQFTRLGPSLLAVTGYVISFFLLAQALKFMPVGIAYAIWSGLGIVLIALIGLAAFGQKLDLPAVLGMGLILAGILVIQLFSNSAAH